MQILTTKRDELIRTIQEWYPDWQDFRDARFQKDEIEYKRAAAAKVQQLLAEPALRELVQKGDFAELRQRLIKAGQATNLLYNATPSSGDLRILHRDNLDWPAFAPQMLALLHGAAPGPERLQGFVDYCTAAGLDVYWAFPTYFLFLCHPEAEVFVKPEVTRTFCRLIDPAFPWSSKPTGQAYAAIREVARAVITSFAEYGAHDMIDAHAVIWTCGSVVKESKAKSKDAAAQVDYWRIAPGRNAQHWAAWREGGYIAIGWEKLGDLRGMNTSAFAQKVAQLGEEDEEYNEIACAQVWQFATQIKPGDFIVANQGKKRVLALGRVTGPYTFVPDAHYGHRLPVEWYDVAPRQVDEGSWFKALMRLDKAKFNAIAALPPDAGAMGEDAAPNADPALQPPYPLARIAAETGFAEEELAEWVQAIGRKRQAILYGPPGTGKTFLAEKLAQHLAGGGDGFWEVVQFHPAYAYEDFVQGIRPQPGPGGGLTYAVTAGRFLDFCARAAARTDPCVLIIDEINRANLGRVFGELMYLLEYRDRAIPLAAGGERFAIPLNVRILGTMNTADRSIALVDHALRRRFAFIPLPPNLGALRAWHQREATGFPVERLADVLEELNRQIDDFHYSVGISFFTQAKLEEHIASIWRMEIEPYLEEYFFDRPDALKGFRWAQVEQRLWDDDGRDA